jgi:RHS repeat-associated protein
MKRQSPIIALLLCALLPFVATAQMQKPYDGYTPSGLSRGDAPGGLPLSGFERINLATGSLHFSLPVLTIGGRGAAGVTLYQNIEKRWTVDREQYVVNCAPDCIYDYRYYLDDTNWTGRNTSITPGYMLSRHAGQDIQGCQGADSAFDTMLTRLSFFSADGSETQFVDAIYNGQPKGTNGSCTTGFSRGNTWYSTDGSAMTFVSDSAISDFASYSIGRPTGNLMMKDGTRYRIVAGNVESIRDRNGNKITFQYSGDQLTQITDALNRVYTVSVSGSTTTVSWKGYQGASRSVTISLGSTWLRPDFSPFTYSTAFPQISALQYPNQDIGAGGPTSITFPADTGQTHEYRLWYNNYGELARVDLPTGGRIEYDWEAGYGATSSGAMPGSAGIHRRISKRRAYTSTSATTPVEETSYSRSGASSPTVVERLQPGTTTVIASEKHYFFGDPTANITFANDPVGYSTWSDNLEDKVEFYSGSSTLLRTMDNDWEPRVTYTWGTRTASFDPRLVRVTTTLHDVSPNLVTKEEYTYSSDAYNNIIQKDEFDWGSGSPGSLLRRTATTYLTTNPNQSSVNYATDTSIHIRNLPVQVSVYDAGGTERARTVFDYDNYSMYGLVDRSGIVQFDSSFTTSYQKRGNATSVTRHIVVGGSTVVTSSQFDIAGNLVKLVDPRGKVTDFDFTDNFGGPNGDATTHTQPSELASGQHTFAFPTKATNAVGHESFKQFDYYLGQTVDAQDANGVVISTYYADALDRVTKQISAVGLPAQMQIFYTHDDANRKLIVETDQTASDDKNLKSASKWDGLGRTIRAAKSEGSSNWSIVDTEYDGLGRAYRTSNPYRSTNYDTASTPSGTWTTISFDGLGRVISTETPDGATSTVTYSGNATTVQDPASKKNKIVADGLGRATSAVSDPGGAAETTTTYVYNVFDKLVKSTQVDGADTQNRYWLYDGLGRLKATRVPEQSAPHSITDAVSGNNSWSNTITYDENGNVLTKTDPRSVVTYFGYDDINRLLGYGDDSSSDLPVAYHYDRPGLAYGKGRLDYAENFSSIPGDGPAYSKLVVDTYDPFGRVKKQTTSLSNTSGVYQRSYAVEQTYNLAGQVTQVKYPSGRTVNTTFDQAGRVATMNGNLNGSQSNYITAITYNPAGQPLRESWPTNTALYLNRHYNNRLQNYDIRLGTSSTDEWGWNRGALRYYYASNYAWGDGGTNNNGNLWRAEHFIPLDNAVSDWVMATQYYNYDAFNRLEYVQEFSETWISGAYSNTQAFKQIYLYDKFGNRRIDATNSTGSINKKAVDINKTNNRVAVPSGQTGTITYDNAGNMIYDSYTTTGGSANRQFDGHSRLTRSYDGGQVDYVYDTIGKRARKRTASAETWYIYGIGGELLAEYNYNTVATAPRKEYGYKDGQLLIYAEFAENIKWVVNDVLGTPRMFVDWWGDLSGGAGMQRHDYLPFGEELLSGVGVRTINRGYPVASISSKGFTGQYHDGETGLDYFGARYYNNIIGRFVSVDPLDAASQIGRPQGWNRYSYVRNQPTSHVDPDGMKPLRNRYRTERDLRREVQHVINGVPIMVRGDRNAKILRALADHFASHEGYAYSRTLGRTIDLNHFFAAAANTAEGSGSIITGTSVGDGALETAMLGLGVEVVQGLAKVKTNVRKAIWDYLTDQLSPEALEIIAKSNQDDINYHNATIGFGASAFSPEDLFSNSQGFNWAFLYSRRRDMENRLYNYFLWLNIGSPKESKEDMWENEKARRNDYDKKKIILPVRRRRH